MASGSVAGAAATSTLWSWTRIGLVDGKPDPALSAEAIDQDAADFAFAWQGDGGRHWIRFELRKGKERLMMTNPVHVNFGNKGVPCGAPCVPLFVQNRDYRMRVTAA